MYRAGSNGQTMGALCFFMSRCLRVDEDGILRAAINARKMNGYRLGAHRKNSCESVSTVA